MHICQWFAEPVSEPQKQLKISGFRCQVVALPNTFQPVGLLAGFLLVERCETSEISFSVFCN
jgi:hypothetical protein